MTGWKVRQTLFHRTLPATAGGPTNTTGVEWHLKVKDIEYDVSLTKNYFTAVSMHKISSIHKAILKIQQILGSHELNGHAWFLPMPTQKSSKYVLAFLNLHQHVKNQFVASILSWDTVNFEVLWPDWPLIFDYAHPKILWLLLNLCKFVSTWKKSGYSIDLFWRFGWLKIVQSITLMDW